MIVKAAGRHILPKEPLIELLLTDSEHRPRLQATSTVLNPLLISGASINVSGSCSASASVTSSSLKLTFDFNIIMCDVINCNVRIARAERRTVFSLSLYMKNLDSTH